MDGETVGLTEVVRVGGVPWIVELDGAPPIVGKPGTVGHVLFKQRHQATAGDEGARVVVFRVHTKGQPWRYLDHGDGDEGLKK